ALRVEGENPNLSPARNRLLARLTSGDDSTVRSFAARADARRPMLAPHFATQILNESTQRETRTTLDLDFQKLIERRIVDYVAANRSRGIRNGAAMLIDFRTMEVLAQIGSADFSNEAI